MDKRSAAGWALLIVTLVTCGFVALSLGRFELARCQDASPPSPPHHMAWTSRLWSGFGFRNPYSNGNRQNAHASAQGSARRVGDGTSAKNLWAPAKHYDPKMQAVKSDAPVFRLPSFFSDNMVLQGAPLYARIWGWGQQSADVVASFGSYVGKTTVTGNGTWTIEFENIPHGGPYTIDIRSGDDMITLKNVMFGDVFFCSGQSNMQMPVDKAFNASAEIADSINYPNLRMYTATTIFSPVPLDDSVSSAPYVWGVSSPETLNQTVEGWAYVSATCYFFGRELIRQDRSRIVGLLISTLGGTAVECWSSMDALKECITTNIMPSEHSTTPTRNLRSNQLATQLYNGMIVPFLKMGVRAFVWYQGEANTDESTLYECQFPAMIKDWRRKFANAENAPFLFVQLAPVNEDEHYDFPPLRSAQEEALLLPSVGMAVTYDLADPNSPIDSIHPRNKQDVARRLALLAESLVYGNNDVKDQGPRFLFVRKTKAVSPSGGHVIQLGFDIGGDVLSMSGTESCTTCCTGSLGFEIADPFGNWIPAEDAYIRRASNADDGVALVEIVSPKSVLQPRGVRFAYSCTPQCAIYNSQHLPAAPFVRYFY